MALANVTFKGPNHRLKMKPPAVAENVGEQAVLGLTAQIVFLAMTLVQISPA
jgi:hypothetical protein